MIANLYYIYPNYSVFMFSVRQYLWLSRCTAILPDQSTEQDRRDQLSTMKSLFEAFED
jgi:hypothetical protein